MRTGDRVLTYVVEQELGEGGMGTVYLARHTVLNQQVAIKVLSPLLSRDHAVRERFIQEADIQAALRHPGIVQVLNAGYEGEQPVLVMEYVEGNSLFEVLERRGALPIDDALKIMKQVLSAVDYAHRQGVIHRDLKPENIMVTAVGDVKVTDFGIAKVLGSARLTRTGTVMGSAYYMSPEQIMNPESVDARSDIYSLGCMFYELLSGRPPFGEKHASGTDNDFRVKSAHVNEAVPVLPATVPNWLTELVMSLLEKSTDKRPSSCEVILESIEQRLKGQTASNDMDSGQKIHVAANQIDVTEMGSPSSLGNDNQQSGLNDPNIKRLEARLRAEEFARNQEIYKKQRASKVNTTEKIKEKNYRYLLFLSIYFFIFLIFLIGLIYMYRRSASEVSNQNINDEPLVTDIYSHVVRKTENLAIEIQAGNPNRLNMCPPEYKIDRNNCWGEYILTDGDAITGRYVGEFSDGKRQGLGTYKYANGNIYIGQVSNNNFHGLGKFSWHDGQEYTGEFDNDKRQGKGRQIFQNGQRYFGNWKEDKFDGPGIIFSSEGAKKRGVWKEGIFLGE